jgi:hypothetical protein
MRAEFQFYNNHVATAELDLGRSGHDIIEIQGQRVSKPQEMLEFKGDSNSSGPDGKGK